MKRLNLMLMVLAASMIFLGCQKDNSVAPDLSQTDQEIPDLKSGERTFFAGRSDFVQWIYPGNVTILPNGMMKITDMVAEWRDVADPADPFYTGQTIWYETWFIEPDGSSAKVWGTCDFTLDNGVGTWQLSWHGYIIAYEGQNLQLGLVPCTAEAKVVGKGKSGAVKGMVFHADYTMDFNGNMETFHWSFSGDYH